MAKTSSKTIPQSEQDLNKNEDNMANTSSKTFNTNGRFFPTWFSPIHPSEKWLALI
jgi:hypothetical protein